MAKGTRGGKNSNAKYNGFSVTLDGKTEHYIVVDGEVQYADGRPNTGLLGTNNLSVFQSAFDLEGNVSGVINRINRVGMGHASTLSDKSVVAMQKKRAAAQRQSQNQLARDAYKRKRGVNRHRTYWSAM